MLLHLLREPRHQLGNFAVHHLIRPGRDQLHVGARFLELLQVRRSSKDGSIQSLQNVLVRGSYAAASMPAAMGQQSRLIHIQALRRRDVSVSVYNHACLLNLFPLVHHILNWRETVNRQTEF